MDNASYFSETSIGGVLIIPHAVLSFVATVFVVLRMWTSRYITNTASSVDEWVSIAALVANHLFLISEGVSVHFGYGENIIKVMNEYGGVHDFLRSFVACEILYGLSCPLSKMAVLAMYYRIFSASRLLRYCTWVMAAMMAGWGIAVCAVSIFACDPIRGFWDKSIPSKCIDQNKFFIGITLPNIFFDVATVVLPVREVWHLQLKREKKWAITSIFLLGGSVVVASIARLILFLIFKSSENVTQVILFGHLASSIEVCLAIIAACLPSCAPLLKRTLGKFVSTAKSNSDQGNASDTKPSAIITIGQKSSRKTNNSSLRRDDNDLQGSFERLDDSTSMQGSTDGLYLDGPGQVETKPGKWKQIHVVRDFRVQSNEDIPMRDL
ncbi:related to L-fucose permease [Fusarium torulosum]|uniref:Related to L-fucose permease n=1 Tax=Fusarium torulosum TaxID=33205 RepID=A0AAE8SIR6_9HYPO|nr:related to L-fucose permease [Fusarium torulosum]